MVGLPEQEGIMMVNTIIVCGLTKEENETVRKHKGECRYCMHFDCFYDGATGKHYRRCDKFKTRLEEPKTDCKDWFLDTR